MHMRKDSRRSGFSLVLAGIVGVGCFWVTDPRCGLISRPASADVVQAIGQASPGTYIGIAGSGAVALIGLWLMMRRTT